jgi:hypothetical protein
MSPFNLVSNDTETVMIKGPDTSSYKQGDTISVSKMTFMHRLYEQCGTLFDAPFDWDNIFLAGGFISGLLETKYDPDLYKESDIDMYICAKNCQDLSKRVMKVIEHIKTRTKNVYFIISGDPNVMLIDCLIDGWTRRLQLIGVSRTGGKTVPHIECIDNSPMILNVIGCFDFTHCQVAFDGNEVVCTPEFIRSLTTRRTKINPLVHSIHGYRLIKAHIRGYTIIRPEHDVYIKNFFHRYGRSDDPEKDASSKFKTLTDRIWHTYYMDKEFPELLVNPIVHQNLHKNFVIDFNLDDKEHLNTIDQLTRWTPQLKVYDRYGHLVLSRYEGGYHTQLANQNIDDTVRKLCIVNILTR